MSPTTKRRLVALALAAGIVAIAGPLMATGQFFRMNQFGGIRAYFDPDTVASGQFLAHITKDPATGSALTGASLYSAYRAVSFPSVCQEFGPTQLVTSTALTAPTLADLNLATSGVRVKTLAFANGADNYVSFSTKLPDNLPATGNVTLNVFWVELVGAAAQTVIWDIKNLHAAANASIDTAGVTATGTSTTNNTTSTVHKDTVVQSIASLGWAAGDIVEIQLKRKGTADTYTSSALVLHAALDVPIDPVKEQ